MSWKGPFDYWVNKLEILAKIAIPVVLVFLGHQLESSYRAKEEQFKQVGLNQKYIEIAVGILNTKPTSETMPLRDWAIDTIDKYSEIKLSKDAKALLKQRPLSKTQYLTDEKGNYIADEKGNRLTIQ